MGNGNNIRCASTVYDAALGSGNDLLNAWLESGASIGDNNTVATQAALVNGSRLGHDNTLVDMTQIVATQVEDKNLIVNTRLGSSRVGSSNRIMNAIIGIISLAGHPET